MTDQQILSSFPSRPFSMTEINALEARDRIHSIVVDDFGVDDDTDHDLQVSISSCVVITTDSVTGAVYIADDDVWHRVYHAPRPGVELTEAYEAIRAVRGEDTLFAAHPLSPREAIYQTELDNKLLAGKPRSYETDEGETNVAVRPESINHVEEPVRDRWVVETAAQTIERIQAFDAETNDYAHMAREEYGDSISSYREEAIAALESLETTDNPVDEDDASIDPEPDLP
jgi:hypothetical protein